MSLLKRMTSIAAFVEDSYVSAHSDLDTIEAGRNAAAIQAAMFYCYDLDFSPTKEVLRRAIYRGSLGQTPPMMGAASADLSFTVELMGNGTAGEAPPCAPMLKMCGYNETTNSGRCVGYEPKDPSGSDPLDSGTFYLFQDGLYHRLIGNRGTFTLNCESGNIATLACSMSAMNFDYTDSALLAGTAYPTQNPPIVVSAGFVVGSTQLADADGAAWTDAVIPAIGIDMNNTIARGGSINTASGYKSVEITGRGPTGTMSPEAVLVATHPFYTDWVNGYKADLYWIVGSVAGNRVLISIPGTYYNDIAFEDRDGVLAHGTPFDVCLSGSAVSDGMADSGNTTTVVDTALFTVAAANARTYVGRRITMTYGDNSGEIAIITAVDGPTNTATVFPAFTNSVVAEDLFDISEKEIQMIFY